jgi:3-keto-5-aminohexanoate cleavage enzyme
MGPIWLEAAINGPWGRTRQPGIPITTTEIIADGIAVARAGAAIVHLHVYDEATGRQTEDWQVYARAIEGIRSAVDVIVYPTIPIAGLGFAGDLVSASGRYAHLEELGKRGLVEWGVIDPGSVNFAASDDLAAGRVGFVYQNPEEHIREGLEIAERHRLHPSFAIYEPGFTRTGAALAARYPGLPVPIYRLMFSDDFMWGFPPREWALEAHLALLAECAPGAPVMIAGLRVDVSGLVEAAVARGVHVRAGLEDAAFGETRSNRALVEHAARLITTAGCNLASTADVRAALDAIKA